MAAKRKPAARKPPRKAAARRPRKLTRTRKTATKRPVVRKPPAHAARKAAVAGKALRLAGVGSAAVLKATGRAWEEWLRVLDRAGAKAMPHKEIALMLSRKFSVPDWWSQMVTVGYEQARGLRAVYQHADGFAANASKTVAIERARLYAAWSDPKQRLRWLPNAPLEVSRSTDGKSMRMRWTQGGSRVDVGFFAKGADKSLVQVQHAKLPDALSVKRQKAYWGEALDRLKALLEGAR